MPLEVGQSRIEPVDATPAALFLSETRNQLRDAVVKIEHCLGQLTDAELALNDGLRPNSVQTQLLHVAGNVRQWIIVPLTCGDDHRDRAAEFAPRPALPRAELWAEFTQTLAEADAALAAFPPERLAEPILVQGFATTYLGAIYDSTAHLVGHMQQIVLLTRQFSGDAYRFQWTPPSSK
jgi:hypothetical protein